MPDQLTIAERISALMTLDINARVLGLLEYGIEGCSAENAEQVQAALVGLLDEVVQDEEIDAAFRRVYRHCQGETARGRFDRVKFILTDLSKSRHLPVDVREPEP